MRFLRSLLAGLMLCVAAPVAGEPTVFAAASTARALDDALDAVGQSAVLSFGASGTIARQIEQGAPADLFISANPHWMEYLAAQGLVDPAQVTTLVSNRLVLIAPASAPPPDPADLDRRAVFVMSDPAYAPIGQYGRASLEASGLWAPLAPHFVPTRNAVATVAAVASGDAALGLVYASDAEGVETVQVVDVLSADSHPAIRYLIAPLDQGGDAEGALDLAQALREAPAQAVFAAHGFSPVERLQ